jgi:Uma2 family endonuclease
VVQATRQHFTFQEYLELEERSQAKHEYLDGLVWAMAGGSPDHAAIAANVIGLLSAALRDRPCRVFTSDLRVRVQATGLGTYPDVTVVCGPLKTDPDDPNAHTVINPSVVFEVLSKSTEQYDRGEKLGHYQRIESLAAIVLLAHDERRAEVWRRDGERWTLDVAHAGGSVSLPALGCSLALDDVYRDPTA